MGVTLFGETMLLLKDKGFSCKESPSGGVFQLEGKKYPEKPRILTILLTRTGKDLAAMYYWHEKGGTKMHLLGCIDGVSKAAAILSFVVTVLDQIPAPEKI